MISVWAGLDPQNKDLLLRSTRHHSAVVLPAYLDAKNSSIATNRYGKDRGGTTATGLKNGAATDPSSCSLEYSSFNNESIFNNMQAADEISVRT